MLARKDISRHRTSCALHSGISTSHLPEDQHLSRISATTVHGFVLYYRRESCIFDAWDGILKGAAVSERFVLTMTAAN